MTDEGDINAKQTERNMTTPTALPKEDVFLELRERCARAGIAVREETDEFLEEDYAIVDMPNGREKRRIVLWNDTDLPQFLSVPFERFVFLGDYEAICSYDNNVIEAFIRSHRYGASERLLGNLVARQRTLGAIAVDDHAFDNSATSAEALSALSPDGVSVAIGYASREILAVRSVRTSGNSRPLSIRISGAKFTTHDQALEILDKISNSIFFQIDRLRNIPLSLTKAQKSRFPSAKMVDAALPLTVKFPEFEYDKAPMSLYWYGRNAVEMPLLQFLAFYQVIEFYFPTYSQKEAARKLRVFLKDPAFRYDRDTDIGKLLSTMGSVRGSAFGGERAQLRSTIHECVDAASLEEFLMRSKPFKEFFTKPQKGLTSRTISADRKDHDLRDQAAELIYDIRCKIVHTKDTEAGSEIELILPFSKEADLLQYDIELIEHLARQVLIAASSPLKLL